MIGRNLLSVIVRSLLALALVGAGLGTAGAPASLAAPTPDAPLPARKLAGPGLPAVEADAIWSIETVDGAAGAGNYSSLGIDALDHLHVAYYDMANTALKYAHWTGGSWITETVDNSASVGQYAALDLDDFDQPHLSYYDLTHSALKYAHWNGSTWISDTVDNSASVGTYASLAYLPSSNNIHISYHDETGNALKYIHWNGSAWISTTVDSAASVGTFTSLAFRGTSPRISYHNATSNTLRYAVYQAGSDTWYATDLTPPGGGGKSTSMGIDSDGYEHISHYRDGGEVHYIYQDAGGWHDRLVEASCGEFVPTSLALDGDDRPHIAYVHGDGSLRYAWHDGLKWQIETVDDSGEAGGDALSLALDGGGYPHITYWGATGLQHAWLHPAPDLVVTDIWQDGGQIWYQVHNIGADTAPAGHYVSLNIDGVTGFTDTVPIDLDPGQRYAHQLTAWSCSGLDDDLRLTADHGEMVDELDESNNGRREIWNCDTLPPQFTQLPAASLVQPDSVVIEWGTDENSDSRVYFDQMAGAYSQDAYDAAQVTAHQVTLSGLSPSTAYHYRVESTDASSNTVTSGQYFFETAALPPIPLTGTMTIERRSGAYPAYDVTVTVSNTTQALASGSDDLVSRAALYLNDQHLSTTYSGKKTGVSSAEYHLDISPADLGLTPDEFFVGPGDPWHGVTVEVYNFQGATALTLMDTMGPARVEMPADVALWTPPNNAIYYTDESGVLPPGTTIPLAAEAMQYEWECQWGWTHGLADPNCGDVVGQVDEVQFYVDDQLVHTSTGPQYDFVHGYDWNAAGLPVGSHTVEAVAIASDGSEHHSQIHTFAVEQGWQALNVSRAVTRYDNYLQVELTLAVAANASGGVYLDDLRDFAHELMPVPKSEPSYRVSSHYTHGSPNPNLERRAMVVVDFRTSTGDLVYLAPGASLVVTYDLVPILYEDGQANPRIGASDLLVSYVRNAVPVESHYALPWQSLPAVQDALGLADYLLVTNPGRLYNLYAGDEVHDLLGTMAHLARIRNGALGFLDTYVGTYADTSSEDILQTLTRPGGYWADSLHPNFQVMLKGYMLIVGETEVVPAWDTHDFDICWDIPDDWAHCRVGDNDVFHHDQWYSSTGGDGRPELVVGRIIGDSAGQLAKPLQASIAIHEGLPGSYYEAPGNALLVSGRGRGVGSFEWHVQVVGGILDDDSGADDWGVNILNLPDIDPHLALQNELVDGISLLHLMGHGDIDGWGGGGGASVALATSIPPSLYNYRPFVFAVACLTGDYEKGDDYNLAESLFDQGVATYIGATQKSPGSPNGEIAARFYGDNWQWTNGEALGRAFGQAERYWYNEWAYYDWYRFWVVEYNFYGDPKFGASTPSHLALTTPAPATVPTTTLHVTVPDYVITTTVDGFDQVDIPGGPVLLEGGLHRVPYWSLTLDYAPGYRVQDVELTLRSGRALTTGLILSTTVMTYYTSVPSSGGPTQTLSLTEDDDWFPALDEIYDWQVSDHPDGSSELTIQLFPFHYQPATTNAEWYGSFDFDISVISTSVGIDALQLDGSRFVPGDPVRADLWLDNGAAPVDAIVAPTVHDLASGDTVDGLELHALHGLAGPATYSLAWDSSGFAPGQYQLWVDILDSEGRWLDSASQIFRLGIAAVEISTFDATPDFFHPGDPVNISMVVHNTGSMPLSGEAIIQVQTGCGLTTTAVFTHPLTGLAPGAEIAFDDVWDTSGETEVDYRVLGYVKYNSRASEVETVHLTTRQRIYLPLIQRASP